MIRSLPGYGFSAKPTTTGWDPVRTARGGHVGMRERAATFGGTVDAAPLPLGGFEVVAFLPVTVSTAERWR